MNIYKRVRTLEYILQSIKDHAKDQYNSSSPCPLAYDHHYLSKILDGAGQYRWKCIFCETTFED